MWQLVDFKWLAAGQGLRVDVPRMERDPAYAADCLMRALQTACEPLHACSRRLLRALCSGLPDSA